MSLRTTLFPIILLICSYGIAQVTDDFSDGDFTSNPVWSGDVSEFQIIDGQLNSNGPSSTAELYLSTPNSIMDYTVWEFYVEMGFAPSGSNRIRVYLVSNQADLEGALDGYYVEIGQTGDDYVLLKRSDSGVGTTLLSGTTVFSSQVRVKIIRTSNGEWTLLADHSGGQTFTEEGSITENTYTSNSYFGVVVNHTSSRNTGFFFDDFQVEQVMVDTLITNSSTELTIDFNQPLPQSDIETISNYSISGITINSATQDVSDASKVTLTLHESTPLTTSSFSLNVSSTLTKNSDVSYDFDYLQLELEELLTLFDTEIQLDFNDELDQTSAETVTNYSIDNGIGQPSSAALDSEDHSKVNLTLSTSLFESTTFQLTATGINNESGNSTFSGTQDFTFVIPLVIDTVYATSISSCIVEFNKSLNESIAETAGNYSLSGGVGTPSTVTLQTDGKSVELEFGSNFEDAIYTLTVNSLEDTDGNEIATNSTDSFDYLNLDIEYLEQASDLSIKITFNQEVDESTAETLSNYSLSEIGQPTGATRSDSNLDEVILNWDQLYNSSYVLTISNISNSNSNSSPSSLTQSISINKETSEGHLIINEFLADPTPAIGLPEAEFVEIYNTTNYTIELSSFTLDGQSIGSYNLPGKGYVVLTDNSDVASFSTSNIVGVSSMGALTNTVDAIILKDQFGNLVDSINYVASEWFNDDIKNGGGYSLERVDPLQPCSDENNWSGSNNESGGTPGEENSVFDDVDNTAPEIQSVDVIGGDSLSITFSEPIDESTITTSSFDLDGFTFNSLIKVSYTVYFLVLSSDLTSEVTHSLIIENISDCRGNELASQTFDFYYDVKPPVLDRIDLFSETELILVFDEPILESPAEDESNYTIDGLSLDRATLQDSAASKVLLEFDEEFTLDASYSLSYGNIQDTLKNQSSNQIFDFTYTSDIDTVWVETANVLVLNYKEVPSTTATNVNNYYIGSTGLSPDTIIHKDDIGITEFRLSFSENFDENKELALYITNVFASDNETRLATPAVSFAYDTRAPSVQEVVVKNDSQVVVVFNESIQTTSGLKSANYLLDETYQPETAAMVSSSEVLLTFEAKFINDHRLAIQRIIDLSGNEMSSTRRLDFTFDINPPLVLGVYQISPTQIQMVFDERVEKSSAINLSNYVMNSNSPDQVVILGPDSTTVNLTFTALPEDANLKVYVRNVKDQYDNASDTQELIINTLRPRLVSLKASTKQSILLTYSQAVSGADKVVNYSLEGFIVEFITMMDDQNYQLFISDTFEEADSLLLSVNNVVGTNNEVLQENNLDSRFDVRIEDFGMVNDRVIFLDFKNDLKEVNPEYFEVTDKTISFVSWDSEDRSLVRLTLANDIDPNALAVVKWNSLEDVFDRVIPDYEVEILNDKTSPYIISNKSDFYGKIHITFSEVMDQSGLLSVNKYSIEGIGNPKFTTLNNDSTVTLDFDNQLIRNEDYFLKLYPLADLDGNLSIEETIQLTYSPPALPEFGEIIITELMVDPTPAVGLPEVEYVELFNNSSESFDLRGVVLEDESGDTQLSEYHLGPSEYVLLVDEGNASLFESENVLEVADFPSLSNSGEQLVLKTLFGDEVNLAHYSSSWYGDSNKDDGGYSLEIVDPNGGCTDSQNWQASTNELGGTPGFQNSVYRVGEDGTSPLIDQFEKNSTSEFTIIFNEAMDSLSLVNSTFYVPGYPVDELTVSGDLHEVLIVKLIEELPLGAYYSFSISGAKDCTGTSMSDTTFVVGLGKEPLPGDLLITEIMADPDPQVGLPSAEYIEIFNNTDAPIALDSVRFRDDNSSRLIGDVVIEDSTYAILVDIDDAESFTELGVENVIGLEDWPSLTNSGEHISLTTDVVIDEAQYDSDWFLDPEKKSGGYSLEIINPNGECPGASNWGGSVDVSGGTPGRRNSIYNEGPDAVKPVVTSFEVIDSQTLRFTFNEVMDSLSLLSANIEGVTVVSRSVSGENRQVLTVGLIVPLAQDEVVEILISEAADCSGNIMDPATFEVAIGVAPEFNELVITEIMSDPDPAIELPNSEYLELYNRSDKLLSLDGVQLIDATDTVDLPAVTIRPDHYLLICPTSRVADFSSDIDVTGVPGWSALNNSGEPLTLVSEGELIFQIMYELDWHGEDAQDGGVSLEMKDVNNPCGQVENWTSSIAIEGGTPGLLNAATEGVPDNFGPTLVSARALNTGTIELLFDEQLGANSPNNTVLIFEPSLAVERVLFAEDRQSLYVFLQDELVVNQPVTIEVYGTIDCLGNSVKTNSTQIVLSDVGTPGDLVLNELLFNPRSEGVDFIELHNISNKYIDLNGWKIGRRLDDGSIDYEIIDSHVIIAPEVTLALTTDTIIIKNHYPKGIKELLQLSSLPTMPNSEGTVVITNVNDVVVDEFTYDEDYHLSFLENVDGVSLERIDANVDTQNPDNWTSASSAVGYATPGYTNSQSYEIPVATAVVSIEPKVFVPGNRSAAHQSFTTINYQLDQTGQFANITVYNQMGQPIADLGKGISLGSSGFIRWDGTSFDGSVVRRGYYVVLFELYDGSGKSQTLKETVVVGK